MGEVYVYLDERDVQKLEKQREHDGKTDMSFEKYAAEVVSEIISKRSGEKAN